MVVLEFVRTLDVVRSGLRSFEGDWPGQGFSFVVMRATMRVAAASALPFR
jgi:hypothetical protein